MEDVKNQFCRLCLIDLSENKFEIIGDVIKDILDGLALKLNFSDNDSHVMCTACSAKLSAAFKFKEMCVYTEDVIIHYIEDKQYITCDLKEIYLKEKGEEQIINISDNHNVCRLCMQLVQDFMLLSESEVDMIQKFIPEMNFHIIKDPVICRVCSNSLVIHHRFLQNCSEIEAITNTTIRNEETKCSLEIPLLDSCIKTEFEPEKVEQDELFIKTECIDVIAHKHFLPSCSKIEQKVDIVKSENIDSPEEVVLPNSFIETELRFQENEQNKSVLKTESVEIKSEEMKEESVSSSHNLDKGTEGTSKCNENCKDLSVKKNKNIIQSKRKGSVKVTTLYECDECEFKSPHKRRVSRHQLTHKNPSELQMYKCDECDFETKYKEALKRHQLQYRNVQAYKCEKCDYESKCKNSLKSHQLKHSTLDVKMYDCAECEFKTPHMAIFLSHTLKHQPASKTLKYKCEECEYRTSNKKNLACHQLKLKHTSEMHTYKCDQCDYKSAYKSAVNCHQLKHKVQSEVPMNSCDECDYKSRNKSNFARHRLKHNNPKVRIYKCERCEYKTMTKKILECHQLQNQHMPEVQTYKCEECDCEFKYKKGLKRHQLKHTD